MVNVTNRIQGMFTVTNTMVNSTLVQLLIFKKQRKQEHKDGTKSGSTKFQHAIKLHGFDNFKYKVLQTIQYSNICELWELEDTYIKNIIVLTMDIIIDLIDIKIVIYNYI